LIATPIAPGGIFGGGVFCISRIGCNVAVTLMVWDYVSIAFLGGGGVRISAGN